MRSSTRKIIELTHAQIIALDLDCDPALIPVNAGMLI
jgi:hypothetical protein